MNTIHIVQTILECAAIVAVIWGIKNENKLIKWERKFFRRIKERFIR